MKNFVRILALVLALAMVVTCFAGCGKKKTLVMGTNAEFPPYEYVDDNGKIVGIDAEIAQAIAEKMGYELEIQDMKFDSLITAVQSGNIDFALAGMTVDEERLLSVNFSDTYATGVQVVIVKDGSAIATVDDLDGKIIGVQSGTTGDIYCTDDYGQENVKQYDNGALAVAALMNGQVDCVVIDNEPAKNYVKANAGLKILDTEYAVEDYAAAIAKENTELLDNFNKALKELKDEGKLDEIIKKYIPAE
ncbi:MAG: basic amino acid ABC transporter substrate-binding protein [Acutalibacteraceae bacterium]|nr:basic amino acid ABC transporter substrate-binding protein [Acutalibacteraceae bacterium]